MLQIREAFSNEIDWVRKQRVRAYEEHAQKVPSEHWNALIQPILSYLSPFTGCARRA